MLSGIYNYHQKLEWECKLGHKWFALFNNIKQDIGTNCVLLLIVALGVEKL